jgi:hypothetical protein
VIRLVDAGADIVAVDATRRPRPDGTSGAEFLRLVKSTVKVAVMADISNLDEGLPWRMPAPIMFPRRFRDTPKRPNMRTAFPISIW